MNKEQAVQCEEAKKELPGFCMQLGSDFCKNECPNGCYDKFQNLINKLFDTPVTVGFKIKP